MKLGLLALALVFASGGQIEPKDADWTWLDQARPAAFESLMPVVATEDVLVTYFSYRDLYFAESEEYFSIRSLPGDPSPSAYIVKPVGASLQKQLLDMHLADRSATASDLIPRLKVSQMRISGSACSAVGRALDAMLKLPPPEPEQELLVIHPRIHRIIQVHGGRTVDLSLVNDYHPLVVWAAKSLVEMQKCASAK